jgi:nitrous oxide reductase accessory protein NosL
MKRRQFLQTSSIAALALGVGVQEASAQQPTMPWEWIEKKDSITNTDGTPLQFMPKGAPDPDPLTDELKKYPMCPYCGMSRTKFSHTRHLIHYADDLVDGTCSLHCAVLSLSLNMDRGPKAIYVGDAGANGEIKPLIAVEEATYTIISGKPGTMTARRKWAYGDKAKAQAAVAADGGELADFNGAMAATYQDIAQDTIRIRKNRADRRAGK